MRSSENKLLNESYSLKPQTFYHVHSCMIRNSTAMRTNSLLRVNIINRNWQNGNRFSTAETSAKNQPSVVMGKTDFCYIMDDLGFLNCGLKGSKWV